MPRITSKYLKAIIVAILPLLVWARELPVAACKALGRAASGIGRANPTGAKQTAVRWRAFPVPVQNGQIGVGWRLRAASGETHHEEITKSCRVRRLLRKSW